MQKMKDIPQFNSNIFVFQNHICLARFAILTNQTFTFGCQFYLIAFMFYAPASELFRSFAD